MKFSVTNKIHQYLFQILLLVFTFSLPYPAHITSVLIILLGVAWLFNGNIGSKIRFVFSNKLAVLFISLYLLYLAAALVSENKNTSFYILEIKLSLLVFPIIISTSRIDDNLLEKILITFAFTCFLASLASFLNVFLLHKHYGHDLSTIRFDSFNRENISELLKIHPGYLSIYLFFSILIVYYFLNKYWKEMAKTKKLLLILLIVYFLFINILLSARMPILAFLLFTIFISIKYILYQKRNLIIIVVSLFICTGIGAYFYNYPFINRRFKEAGETSWQPPTATNFNSTNLRIGHLICSFELLKDSWLFGVDPGQMQRKLNACYTKHDFAKIMVEENHNPHNQYLQTWLELGIFGLIVLIATFIIPMIIAFQKNNIIYLIFLFFFALCCITESVLTVQKGVVFYAFFNSLFAFHSLYKNTFYDMKDEREKNQFNRLLKGI